ncbi:hypothetical protein QQG55_39290 [Brugia pahangi]
MLKTSVKSSVPLHKNSQNENSYAQSSNFLEISYQSTLSQRAKDGLTTYCSYQQYVQLHDYWLHIALPEPLDFSKFMQTQHKILTAIAEDSIHNTSKCVYPERQENITDLLEKSQTNCMQ